jgi:hypothetical protein
MPSGPLTQRQVRWIRRWMALFIFGVLVFLVGVFPGWIGMDRSRVIGFLQMGVWLTGLGLALLGAFLTVRVVRNGRPMSLRAEIGARLIATGYVVSATATLADFLAIGSHRLPWVYLGPLQVGGLVAGVVVSLIGLVLYWPRTPKPASEPMPV